MSFELLGWIVAAAGNVIWTVIWIILAYSRLHETSETLKETRALHNDMRDGYSEICKDMNLNYSELCKVMNHDWAELQYKLITHKPEASAKTIDVLEDW